MKSLFWNLVPRSPTRLGLTALVISLTGSALIGVAIILVGNFDDTQMRVLATAGSLASFSVLSFPSLFHLERDQYSYLSWPGILFSLLAFVMIVLMIWGFLGGGEYFRILTTLLIGSFSANHALLMLATAPLKTLILICQLATILIIFVVGFLAVIAIWLGGLPDFIPRLFGALVVLDALGTVAVPIMTRIERLKS